MKEVDISHLDIGDPLSGLYNRRYILFRLDEEIKRAKRYGRKFALMLIDMDNFKEINDNFGHMEGDRIIKEFSSLLKKYLRETDLIGRYGGDEFIIVLPNTDREGSRVVAQRLIREVHRVKNSNIIFPSVSIGIAIYPEHGDSVEMLFKSADTALYSVKQKGKDGFQIFSRKKVFLNPDLINIPRTIGRVDFRKNLINILKRKSIIIEGEWGMGKTFLSDFIAEFFSGTDHLVVKKSFSSDKKDDDFVIPGVSGSLSMERGVNSFLNLIISIKKNYSGKKVLIVFDNIHFAESMILEFIIFTLKEYEDIKFFLTLNPFEKTSSLNRYIKKLYRIKNLHREVIPPFTEEEIFKFLVSVFKTRSIQKEIIETLHKKSYGNPMALLEVVKYMLTNNIITMEGNKLKVKKNIKEVPHNIHEWLIEKYRTLSMDEKKVLSISSIIGNNFPMTILNKILDFNPLHILDILQNLEKKGFISIRNDEVVFYNENIRKFTLKNKVIRETKRLHRDIAESLKKENEEDINLIITHLIKGGKLEDAEKIILEEIERLKRDYLYNRVEKLIERFLKYFKDIKDILLKELGVAKKVLGKHQESIEVFKKALNNSRDIDHRVEIYLELADTEFRAGRYKNSLSYIKKVRKFEISEIHNLKSYLLEAKIYQERDIKKAKELLNIILKIMKGTEKKLEEKDRDYIKWQIYDMQGTLLLLENKIKKSKEMYNKALKIAYKLGDKEKISSSLNNLTNAECSMGDYIIALKRLKKALKICEASEDFLGESIVLFNIALTYMDLKQFSKAKKFIDMYMATTVKARNRIEDAYAYMVLGLLALEKKHLIEAEKNLEMALEIFIENDVRNMEEIVLQYMAEIGFIKGDIEYVKNIYKKLKNRIKDDNFADFLPFILNYALLLFEKRSNLSFLEKIIKDTMNNLNYLNVEDKILTLYLIYKYHTIKGNKKERRMIYKKLTNEIKKVGEKIKYRGMKNRYYKYWEKRFRIEMNLQA